MAQARKKLPHQAEDTRMTLGEHLEELRSVVLRSLIALVLACIVFIYPSKFLLELIARPVVLVLQRYDQETTFLQTSPVETILVYIKVVVLFAMLTAAPYVLHQLWSFVAAGLYPHEKKFVQRLVPLSVGLFLAGVLFMYLFVLIISLQFLVGFSQWLPQPDPTPTAWERFILRDPTAEMPTTQTSEEEPSAVPLLAQDPANPPTGTVWVNVPQRMLKFQGPGETLQVRLHRQGVRGLVTTHFRLTDYLSFVLIMTVAFGVAFQMPLVVVFLVRVGIVDTAFLRKYRKIVILLIVFIAGILAPPDLLSHLMLSVPMWLLFELGVLLASRQEKARVARADGT